MAKWINYGKELLPSDVVLANMEVKMFSKQGKYKEAILAKEKLVNNMNPEDRNYTAHKAELERMKTMKKTK